MLKTIRLLNLAPKTFKANNNKIVWADNSRTNKIVMNLSKNDKSKNLTQMPNIGAMKKLIFLTLDTKKIFNHLKQVFIKILIFQHFNLESHIYIETDVLSYKINKSFS